jgi:hypothetical protein
MKVPDSVIIKSLQDEVKALRKKNHEVCTNNLWEKLLALMYGED